ncbi:unnamed protein product, partial [Polarella glacialis]
EGGPGDLPAFEEPAPGEEESLGWRHEMVAVVTSAVQTACQDEAHDTSALLSSITPAEETAVLVGEKMALRELVERQQDRIEVLEDELRYLGSVAPSAALTGVFSGTVARGLSDAGGALSASLSAVLATPRVGPSQRSSGIEVGAEYEIISGRGAIVRNGESLRSDMVCELSPGNRVRVMAVSAKYPRRVEIVSVAQPPGTEAAAPPRSGIIDPQGDIEEVHPQPGGEAGASRSKGVVGWISASSKDGRPLIRAMPTAAAACSAGGEGAASNGANSKQADGGANNKEEEKKTEEVNSVTLSADEWDCLNEANATSVQRVTELNARLHKMGCELLQSFEMRSVLGQLQQ